jgi:glyoxylase-like metal-dependent hydrolase (beta-lactamase superfamily II)
MREILPGVFTWPQFSERHGYDFNGYLVEDGGGALVVDPVEPTPEALVHIEQAGVRQVLLTNRNHFRAAARVRQLTSARVAVHPADAAFVREKGVTVDDELAAGQRVGPFTVVDASGKSPGEVALHWPERRLLLVGDACVGKPPGALALLPPAVIDDLPRLKASLRRLGELDFDALLVCDGASVLEGARAALRALVETFER